jgi:hypothetical protein
VTLLHDLLYRHGYRLIEDAWQTDGRRTYLHDDESADRSFLTGLGRILRNAGWKPDTARLRTFRNDSTGELIEVEPGGAEITGHFLHHLKSD